MSRTPKRIAAAVLVLAAAGAGYYLLSKPPVVDAAKDEKSISDGIFDQMGIVTDDVTCPDDVLLSKGATHRCTARAEGGDITIKVTQIDDRGGTRWRTVRGVVVTAKIEDLIENQARDLAGKEIDVDCGRRHRVAVAERTFECSAESRSGHDLKMRVTMNDDRGNVSWQPEL